MFADNFQAFWGTTIDATWAAMHVPPVGSVDMDEAICPCSLPALGPAFNPQTGAWTMAADAASNGAQTLHLDGLQHPAKVVLEANGTAHISAATDHSQKRTADVPGAFGAEELIIENCAGKPLCGDRA